MGIHTKRETIFIGSIVFILCIFTFIFMNVFKTNVFIDRKLLSSKWFRVECLGKYKEFSLENLPAYLDSYKMAKSPYCKEWAKIFEGMFAVEELNGELKIPSGYDAKIKKWLNNDEELYAQVKNQKIIKLYNKFMHEEMIYNPLRGKRPQPKENDAKKYTDNLLKDSMTVCDFCDKNYEKNTAYDTFGRLETKYSYTAANTFKYDKWHSLIVSRNHDTLNLNEQETVDMFNLALKWFDKVHSIDKTAKYPEVLWDAMPKSGASQVHTHLQASMGIGSYYGAMERLRSACKLYYREFKRDYLDDFILIHQALGLSMQFNKTYVILNLIPVKEHELMIIHTDPYANDEYFKVIHKVIRAYVDVMEKYSFSMGMYLPEYPLEETKVDYKKSTYSHKLKYSIARIVFRTPVSNLKSDINGLDLYTSSVLGIDRYDIAAELFNALTDK